MLNHKRIVPFYGSAKKKDTIYIFIGYMKKGSLADYVAKENGLSEEKTKLFTRQILEGVYYLHSQKHSIIHRNIKGKNVLLEDENNIRLSDFGFSKILHESTNARSNMGSYKWMAPEVICAVGEICYDVKADIWSIGCTAVEMVTTSPPFPELSPFQALIRIGRGDPPQYNLPENSSEALRNFLDRTFKQDPKERPTSEELLKDTFIAVSKLSKDFPKKWTKGRLVSTGLQGDVYIVQDEDNPDDESFVVKELITTITSKDLLLKLFRNDTDVMTKLKHEKIVTFYGFCESGNTLSLFMRYMKMGSLENYIKTKGRLKEKQAQKFTKDILEGVQYLHANNVIHRDISGKHIFLESEENVKLGGFGVSKILRDDWNVKILLKQESELISPGSINWMAPEMVAAIMDDHGSSYDEKVDIWSVGCTVVQMVTGNPPFMDLEQQQITFLLASDKPPIFSLPEHSSPAIKNFLQKTFYSQPSLRPSATELLTKDEFIIRKADFSTDLSITRTPDHCSYIEMSINIKTEELQRVFTTDNIVDATSSLNLIELTSLTVIGKGGCGVVYQWKTIENSNDLGFAIKTLRCYELSRPKVN
ncbi:uncharacterized protein LOC131943246 [Physella acuta]|uniref:uncharacterized protein LOC131943246 n=1 Tax=Physella acuta TaxID=109671 RepID=UPI0027DCAC8D|nr:uncharacterized protein LOC131943246 [Physella acuta]